MTTKLEGVKARERMTTATNDVSVWSASLESQVSVRGFRDSASIIEVWLVRDRVSPACAACCARVHDE